MSSFDDYLDDMELAMYMQDDWWQDENDRAVDIFEEFRAPDKLDTFPDKLE